jgi:hypothetical protein
VPLFAVIVGELAIVTASVCEAVQLLASEIVTVYVEFTDGIAPQKLVVGPDVHEYVIVPVPPEP